MRQEIVSYSRAGKVGTPQIYDILSNIYKHLFATDALLILVALYTIHLEHSSTYTHVSSSTQASHVCFTCIHQRSQEVSVRPLLDNAPISETGDGTAPTQTGK